jgi:hypothetical protein
MLELHLPHQMPHAIPREPPFDFYPSAARPLAKLDPTMQLPMPRMPSSHEFDPMRTAQRAPLTPPDLPGSAVRVVPLASNQGVGHPYGYQLPAIGNSRSVAAPRSPSPPRQMQQPVQEVTQTPRKKWSISPNLRIPSTISTPQEGLPQLAAEVSTTSLIQTPRLTFPGYVPLLVRELHHAQAGPRRKRIPPCHTAASARCAPYDRLQEVGSHDLNNHPSRSKCHSAGPVVHLQAEVDQPHRQRQTRQRV